jgi:hypothetical protein
MQIPNPILSIAISRIIQGWQQEQNIAPQGSNHLSSLCQIIQLIPTPFQVHSVIYLKAKARTARKVKKYTWYIFFIFYAIYSAHFSSHATSFFLVYSVLLGGEDHWLL